MKSAPPPAGLNREYPQLKELRAQIDAIDDDIARLLVARMEVVKQVGVLKRARGESKSFIRPDREAIMLRDLMAYFRETDFPESAAASIWRIIIGASTAMESPLNISVAHGHERGSAVALAREYFGPTLPCRLHVEPEDVLNDMRTDPHCIGVLPASYPAGANGPWWWQMARDTGHECQVFAKLPFVLFQRKADAEPVLLAGNVEPAPSGKDLSLFAIDADMREMALEGLNLMDQYQSHGQSLSLFEAPGWMTLDSPGYAALHAMLSENLAGRPFILHFLGAYAEPLSVDR